MDDPRTIHGQPRTIRVHKYVRTGDNETFELRDILSFSFDGNPFDGLAYAMSFGSRPCDKVLVEVSAFKGDIDPWKDISQWEGCPHSHHDKGEEGEPCPKCGECP